MCQGVVPTCQQTSCSPSQKPSGNFSVCQRERRGEGSVWAGSRDAQAGDRQSPCPQPSTGTGDVPTEGGDGWMSFKGHTDRRSCFDGFHCSLKHLLRQPEVGGAAVHDTLVIVVLQTARGRMTQGVSQPCSPPCQQLTALAPPAQLLRLSPSPSFYRDGLKAHAHLSFTLGQAAWCPQPPSPTRH